VRGLSRLLRRNPTDAERALWDGLVKDRRFAGHDFKRQTPVGPHVADVVSFRLRLVVELVPESETEEAARTRAERRAWMAERNYSVIELRAADVEANLGRALDRLAAAVSPSTP
jgi:tRNA/rRNA methyltransferase